MSEKLELLANFAAIGSELLQNRNPSDDTTNTGLDRLLNSVLKDEAEDIGLSEIDSKYPQIRSFLNGVASAVPAEAAPVSQNQPITPAGNHPLTTADGQSATL